ncbi:glycosyltransferase family 4 protein [Clostridium perfringens]|uniref:glycosyltransferase family 4 protein n=2 Tax=Clostridium perfringens TaxID=1502 RepID=UPI000E1B3377|nr:glycosyltransferase family 4 protein [Clostridium perfringens]EJT6493240.1 glycosyltransferase family 4 protein [Clostridium perfringens]MBI6016197.1 glycosyltransferase family 4 protein [Clostridium perfringens]MDH5064246.1 Glycogen synthase [Clostridium perfringens]MDK0592107.1 glycosyltransferase family 4 protein [Clostridium perfringens]MDK0595132.1 glycosyltransferase family 4 protein [Clostridium perfringens]
MDKKNVLIVHNYYKIHGGEDTVVQNEIKMLQKRNYNVYTYFRYNKEIDLLNIFGKIKMIPNTIFSLKTIKEVREILKSKNIDIIHVHNTFPLISPSIYWIAKKYNIKVINTLHNYRLICASANLYRDGKICEKCMENRIYGLKNKCYRNSYFQTMLLLLSNYFNRIIKSYEKVDKYICLTKFNKSKIKKIINEEKIFIKGNFESNIEKDKSLFEKRENFVYLGRLEKAKGIDLLVKAWNKNVEDKLIIIGDGELKKEIINFIHKNNIENIKILGSLKREKAMNIIKKSKALIFPSQCYETFGLVAIEALKRGTPIIANNLGSIPELLIDKRCGILKRLDDENDIIDAIKEFEDLYKKNYFNNKYIYDIYKDKYTEESNFEILKNIYES